MSGFISRGGGQRETAEYLHDQGARHQMVGHDNLTPLDASVRSDAHHLAAWLQARGGKPAARPH